MSSLPILGGLRCLSPPPPPTLEFFIYRKNMLTKIGKCYNQFSCFLDEFLSRICQQFCSDGLRIWWMPHFVSRHQIKLGVAWYCNDMHFHEFWDISIVNCHWFFGFYSFDIFLQFPVGTLNSRRIFKQPQYGLVTKIHLTKFCVHVCYYIVSYNSKPLLLIISSPYWG